MQINYFGDARATFEYFFPGVIPGDPFSPSPALIAVWAAYYEMVVKPIVMAPANRTRLDAVGRVSPGCRSTRRTTSRPSQVSVKDVLRYSGREPEGRVRDVGRIPVRQRHAAATPDRATICC